MSRTNTIALAAALMLCTGGCGRLYQRPEPAGSVAPCVGRAYLDVRSSLEGSFELYGYVGSASRYLGVVSPGTQRIFLSESVGSVYAKLGDRRVTQRGAKDGNVGGLEVTRGCQAYE